MMLEVVRLLQVELGWLAFINELRFGGVMACISAEKRVIGAMPFLPFKIACQVSSVPTPSGLISPTPVTTTERGRF